MLHWKVKFVAETSRCNLHAPSPTSSLEVAQVFEAVIFTKREAEIDC